MTNDNDASNFPIPAEMQGFWQREKLHFPKPQTVLTRDIINKSISAGFTSAMDGFGCPVGVQYADVNTYAYMTLVPFDLGDETIEQRVGRYRELIGGILPRLRELWEGEWLQSIIPALETSRNRDYTSLNDQELIDVLHQMTTELVQRWTVHGNINLVLVAASMFVDFYNETLEPGDPTEAYEALQGYPTKSVDAGRGLWELGRMVFNSPGLGVLFEKVEPNQLLSELEHSDAGRDFLVALNAYLDEFGWRSDDFELADYTWRENPSVPLNAIRGYIHLDESDNPDVRYEAATRRREELLSNARQALSSNQAKLDQFNHLHSLAEPYASITEDHNYYIDQIGNTIMRLPILEMGRRLTRNGRISEIDDVFHLSTEEINQAFAGTDFQKLVEERKSELDRWSKVEPVPVIGDPPPHEGEEDPLATALGKFFGIPPEPSSDPDIIQGLGASPGIVQGIAKVVRTLEEASKLEKGDIMVCEMTLPPWTPLFSIVAAVVADTGGPLSHCAIVAREYKMPCVVGTLMGTSLIQNGMTLTVDGAKGTVRIDSRI